jgi:hypothetical protein
MKKHEAFRAGSLAEQLHRAVYAGGGLPPGYAVVSHGNTTPEVRRVDGAHTPLVNSTIDARPRAAKQGRPVFRPEDPRLVDEVVRAHAAAGRGDNRGFLALAQRGVPARVVAAICAGRGLVWSEEDTRVFTDWIATA